MRDWRGALVFSDHGVPSVFGGHVIPPKPVIFYLFFSRWIVGVKLYTDYGTSQNIKQKTVQK